MNTSQADRFRECNRPYHPPSESAHFLFRLYRLLFSEAGIELRKKQLMFEAGALCRDSWRVVCISENALKQICVSESVKGLKRAHPISRSERALYLFERDVPVSENELVSYYFENDSVALVTSQENNVDGVSHWSELYCVPEGIFTSGSFRIYLRKVDLEWAKDTCNGSNKV